MTNRRQMQKWMLNPERGLFCTAMYAKMLAERCKKVMPECIVVFRLARKSLHGHNKWTLELGAYAIVDEKTVCRVITGINRDKRVKPYEATLTPPDNALKRIEIDPMFFQVWVYAFDGEYFGYKRLDRK